MEETTKKLKKGFLKKVWYSIFKLERYGEMSAEGLSRAVKYLIQISLVMAIVLSSVIIYQIDQKVNKGVEFLENKVGNFTYKDGILELESGQIVKAPSSTVGEIIIDTNTESEEEINQYLNSIEENMGILILKDKLIIKGISKEENISYKYSTLLSEIGINEIDKDGVVDYISGSNKWNIYMQFFIIICIYSFVSTAISFLVNALLLSFFGWISTWFAKIKMRYVAIFNLAIYSLTLSTVLQAIYVIINSLTGFTITYFQVMYVAVAAIYLIASIFLIKSEFIKNQMEEIKKMELIINTKQDENKEDNEEEPKEENEKPEENPTDKKDDKDKDNNIDKDPEGSEA